MRRPLFSLSIALLSALGTRSFADPVVRTEAVSYSSGAEKVTGFLALPEGKGPFPALIVIHEWWGQNDWVREKARSFARAGYVALAVDLYRGETAADADAAHQLSRGLPEDRASRDLEAAFNWLSTRPDVRKDRIGSVGWCMGGGYSLALATRQPKLAAAVIYYGRLVTDEDTIKGIKTPLLGNFGAEDRGIKAENVREFERRLKAAGAWADFKVYEGSGHAFASSSDPAVFNPEAAKDADARTLAFFDRVLRGTNSLD